ncbi:MAG: RNA polymerase sigma factor [bacterium]|nr:RNA polymerase sigma factor [bacterium]
MNKEVSFELIESAKQSEADFIQLYRHYVKRVFRFLLARTSNKELAEDLTQETFLTVLNKIVNYTPSGAPFSSWLFQIAINHARMHFRKHKNYQFTDIEAIAEILPNQPTYQQEWMDFYLALYKLTDADQELLLMKYVDDMPNQNIAEVLGISENSCGVKLHRALKRLQNFL